MLQLAFASHVLDKNQTSRNLDSPIPRRNSEDTIERLTPPAQGYDTDSLGGSPGLDKSGHYVGGVHTSAGGGKAGVNACLTLSWDISQTVKATKKEEAATGLATKTILKDISGSAKSGQMVAVMGSSGAGKSSFLDCVSMRNQDFDGKVFVNNKPADESYYSMTGFVYQEDLFVPTQTVREHLTFHAMVRMASSLTVQQRLQRVEDVLVEVAMNHCPDTIIGGAGTGFRGISGGEKKRLAFGTELLNDPSIIFADEPTSGLDSYMTRGVCTTMRELANRGKIIMCVIHQPSSQTFDLFTHLLLLAKGRVVYQGPMSELNAYFANLGIHCPAFHNPADFYIQQISIVPNKIKSSMKKLEGLWASYDKSSLADTNRAWKEGVPKKLLEQKRTYISTNNFHASMGTQFWYTLKRNVENQMRMIAEVRARFMNSILMGIILGLIYFNQGDSQQSAKNLLGLFFILTMYQVMISMFSVLQVFPADVKVFMRENLSGANRVSSYFLARLLAEIPNNVIYPIIMASIVYGMAGLQVNARRFYLFNLIQVLVADAAVSVGYLISAMTGHEAVAYALAPLFLMPMALFAGLLLDLSSIPIYLQWLDFFSVIKYGYQLFVIDQYDQTMLSCDNTLICRWPTGESVMNYVGTKSENLGKNIGLLIVISLIFRILAFIFLNERSKRRGK